MLVIHLIAVIAGLLAYYLLIGNTDPFNLAPMSESGFRVVVGLMLAVTVTGIALFALDERIPTGHVTATVVGLGITTSLLPVGGLGLGIGVMSGLHALYRDQGDRISEPRT